MKPQTQKLVVLCAIIVVVAAFAVQSLNLPNPNGIFPKLVIVWVGIAAAVNLMMVLRNPDRSVERGPGWKALLTSPVTRGLFLTIAFYLGIFVIGFYLALAVFLLIMFLTHGGRPTRRIATISVVSALCVTGMLYLVFTVLLGVQTPSGVL